MLTSIDRAEHRWLAAPRQPDTGRAARVLAVLVVLLLVLGVGGAAAQSTGGHVGGGDWGDDDTGGGGGGDDRDGWSTRDGDGWRSNDAGGDGGGGVFGALLILGMMALVFGAVAAWLLLQGPRPGFDVVALRVALDARARPHVQRELDALARSVDPSTENGRSVLVEAAALLLLRLRDSWCYLGADGHRGRVAVIAHRWHGEQVTRARVAYPEELYRRGVVPDAVDPGPGGGPGLILATLVVAVRRDRRRDPAFRARPEPGSVARALEMLAATPTADIVAVDLIWTPAANGDVVTSLDVERCLAGTPHARVDGARVGAVVCDHCGAVWLAETQACTHCGAPWRAAPAPHALA